MPFGSDTKTEDRINFIQHKNLSKFVKKIKEMKWKKGDILVNFEVVLLFIIVLVTDILEIIKENKWLDKKLYKLLELCTQSTIFTYKKTIYE